MSIPIYSPMQKSKTGESVAIIKLARTLRGHVVPFFDVLALKPGTENGQDVEVHLSNRPLKYLLHGRIPATAIA